MVDDAQRNAKFELAELLAELSSAVDRGDRDRIAACYAAQSYDDHGTFKGTGAEFADFMTRAGAMERMHHLLGQSVFDVDVAAGEAWGETFFTFAGSVGGAPLSAWGRYADYFVLEGGAWKLKYRRVIPDHVMPGDDPSAYWPASRDRSDPSYDRLRWPPDPGQGG